MAFTYTYPRPALTVDCCIFRSSAESEEVLLVRRGKFPFEGMWALPGGFVDMEETLMEAAKRELKEETGLTGIRLRQLKAFDKIGRDPRGRTISVVFTGFVEDRAAEIVASSDARDARWFSINSLPPLAFDHSAIIAYALANRLNKS